MDYRDNILRVHILTCIRLAHVIKYHWWSKNIIDGTTYISLYPHIYHATKNFGSRSMMPAPNRQNENVINGFYQFLKSWYLKYPKPLKSKGKFKLNISNEMWRHFFTSGVGSYIFILFGYVPGLYVFSSRIHLLRRGGYVVIYWPLITDLIESTQAQILFPRQMRDGDTE